MKTIQERNAPLLEGKRVEFSDFIEVKVWRREVNEARKGTVLPFTAKVFHADKKNGNDRIYPREVMAVACKQAVERAAEGKFTGCIDHPWSGSLSDTCIRWDDCRMNTEGEGFADGEILLNTAGGKQLEALIDAGVSIGFSTAGYGSAHMPSDDEKTRYGLGEEEYAIVIDEGYEMRRVDAVDDPACRDAWMQKNGNRASGNSNDGQQPPSGSGAQPTTEHQDMKTLTELQAKFPELYQLHQDAIADAVKKATDPLKAQVAEMTKVVDTVSGFVKSFKDSALVQIPFRELSAEESATKLAAKDSEIAALKGQISTKDGEITSLKNEKNALDQKIAQANEAQAQAERKTTVAAKAKELLADNRFAAKISPLIEKRLDDKAFDASAVEAFIKEKTDEYNSLLEGSDEFHFGLKPEPTDPGNAGGSGGKITKEDVKKTLAL